MRAHCRQEKNRRNEQLRRNSGKNLRGGTIFGVLPPNYHQYGLCQGNGAGRLRFT